MSYLADRAPVTKLYKGNQILRRIAQRYMQANPFSGFSVKPSVNSGFPMEANGLYRIDFAKKYPEAKTGDFAYAFTCIRSDCDQQVTVAADMMCGGEVWINGSCVFRTTVADEQASCARRQLIDLHPGINPVFIKARKTALGFAVGFGEACIAWKPIYLYMPFAGFENYLGFAWSKLFHEDVFKTPDSFPDATAAMPEAFDQSYLESTLDRFTGVVYAVRNLAVEEAGCVCLAGRAAEPTALYIDGKLCLQTEKDFRLEVSLTCGTHYLVLETRHRAGTSYGFSVQAENAVLCGLEGVCSNDWLVMGPLAEKDEAICSGFSLDHVGKTQQGQTYWRAGITDCYLRKLRVADNFGKWSYPLGVVLYGLMRTGEYLQERELSDYVVSHLQQVVNNEDYAELDAVHFGVPSISRQIVCLGMLDYCGSCGNALLSAYGAAEDKSGFERIADRVAHYITHNQERLENGMFFRNRKESAIDCMTVWADDLYMSVPFLCRYYTKTQDQRYLDDAAGQILKFKELLYMPDRKLMSHVFNLKHGKRTCVPWGRGNGWVLFALTELLDVLPKEHKHYDDILAFYLDFAQGIRNQCGQHGLWHQVLDEHDSYQEISCTSMFVYAFAKGVQAGRLSASYADYATRGWDSICEHAVDTDGNVYGVCCGSAYSFRSEYYKYELPWLMNDTHGTGIVLLAGVEALKLKEKMQQD